MRTQVSLEPVENVPDDSRVCHYDELTEAAKEQFPVLAEDRGCVDVDAAAIDALRRCDLVKYTDYYAVSVS